MADYEGMTNQDVDPVDVWEEMRDAEFRLDAEQEARELEAEQAQAVDDDDPDDCGGEFVDGSWEGCGICQACLSTSDVVPDEDD